MSYVTGSHHHGFIGPSNGDDESMDAFEAEMRARGLGIFNYGTLNAGDVAVHSAWTMHSSRTNTAAQPLVAAPGGAPQRFDLLGRFSLGQLSVELLASFLTERLQVGGLGARHWLVAGDPLLRILHRIAGRMLLRVV